MALTCACGRSPVDAGERPLLVWFTGRLWRGDEVAGRVPVASRRGVPVRHHQGHFEWESECGLVAEMVHVWLIKL